MHPYRSVPARADDDADVRAYARNARVMQRRSKAIALLGACVAAVAMLDWVFGAYVLSGSVLSDPSRAPAVFMRTLSID